jgi:hypothetical protein
LLTSQEQRKKKIAIAIANYSRGKKGNWNSKWSRPIRRHCRNQYEFSLPGCSLLKSRHHHHQQSHSLCLDVPYSKVVIIIINKVIEIIIIRISN